MPTSTSIAPATFSRAARDFLARPGRFATIATINPDGSPHQTVVWYRLEEGAVVINSRVGRRWPSNLQRDARLSFLVEDGLDYVCLRGVAEVAARGEQAQADIAGLAHHYESPDEAMRSIAEFRTQERISFRLRPVAIDAHGRPAV